MPDLDINAMRIECERVWRKVRYDQNRVLAKAPNGSEWVLSGNPNTLFERSHRMDPLPAWTAAYKHTQDLLAKIRQVQEEISLLQGLLILLKNEPGDLSASAWERILAREQEELATLRLGMKETA